MTFKKGDPGGPGRPKGSRNKLAEDFVKALHEDFSEHGVAAIVQCREENATKYLDVIAKVIPRNFEFNLDDITKLTLTQLEERAREIEAALGIPGSSSGDSETERPQQTH